MREASDFTRNEGLRYIDLFAGVGGFRYAMQRACTTLDIDAKCVFTSEIDKECQKTYQANFHEIPFGDITKIAGKNIPSHDVLLAGFPCQPFSIIGHKKGFEDTRGTLFFDIARILKEKNPSLFVLENVKLLTGHNKGKTLDVILRTLANLGYSVSYKVLNALDYGLPQKRERVFIVGTKGDCSFSWPTPNLSMKTLDEILENDVPSKYYASEHIQKKRKAKREATEETTIWHENKAGNVSAYPFSCALRAGASYNYLLVNGIRRLTAREMFRLQGFPDEFEIVSSYSQARKQAGNSLPVPVAEAVLINALSSYYLNCVNVPESRDENSMAHTVNSQLRLLEEKGKYAENTKTTNSREVQTPISS